MGSEAATKRTVQPMSWQRALIRSVPLFLALLAIGLVYYFVSDQLTVGPRGLILELIILLVLILIVAIRVGHTGVSRSVSIVLLGVVTLAEAISTSALIAGLLSASTRMNDVPHDTALALLRDGALIWLVNILTFAFWYWELDGGGPARRHHMGYHSSDFVFPQVTLGSDAEHPWMPHFVDYLFLAFNTSTAFSPTDTMVLSVRAKLLMMTQALISLAVLAILAARAVNTL